MVHIHLDQVRVQWKIIVIACSWLTSILQKLNYIATIAGINSTYIPPFQISIGHEFKMAAIAEFFWFQVAFILLYLERHSSL